MPGGPLWTHQIWPRYLAIFGLILGIWLSALIMVEWGFPEMIIQNIYNLGQHCYFGEVKIELLGTNQAKRP